MMDAADDAGNERAHDRVAETMTIMPNIANNKSTGYSKKLI